MCISVCLGRWHDFERNVKEGNDEIFFFFLRKRGGIPLYALHPNWMESSSLNKYNVYFFTLQLMKGK